MRNYDFAIIGGGFFGCYIALFLAHKGKKVIVIEKESSLLSRASYINQARVHGGYHYPRSTLTALRSRELMPKFKNEFRECIVDTFSKYYLISNQLSNISSTQFENFCKKIGAPYSDASHDLSKIINKNLISGAYKVDEVAFDSIKLKETLLTKLLDSKVDIKTNSTVTRVQKNATTDFEVFCQHSEGDFSIFSKQVINCTYSDLNTIHTSFTPPKLDLRFEITEICLITPPPEIQQVGLTVMCGPFFSTMPFPSLPLHSLTHVRYTPHAEWSGDIDHAAILNHYRNHEPTAFSKMISDASRYIPCMKNAKLEKSLWEIKALLPGNDRDDGRPILFKMNHGAKGYHCILGGKIDNIYDAIETIQTKLL